jgi:hypothetical protein
MNWHLVHKEPVPNDKKAHTSPISHIKIPITNLNGVDIVGNDNELGLFLLNKRGDGVDTVPRHRGALSGFVRLSK